jgi:hypothetical protein
VFAHDPQQSIVTTHSATATGNESMIIMAAS